MPVFSVRGVGGPIVDALLYALMAVMPAAFLEPELRIDEAARAQADIVGSMAGSDEGGRAEATGS